MVSRIDGAEVAVAEVAATPVDPHAGLLTFHEPRVVGVCFTSDLFDEQVPDAFIDQVYAYMALEPRHTFVVLTKQAARMAEYVPLLAARARSLRWTIRELHDALPNVYHGVSICDQADADERLPHLLRVPGKRWISYGPALGRVDFGPYAPGIHGLIMETESGPGARLEKCEACNGKGYASGSLTLSHWDPCKHCAGTGYAAWAWARETRDACRAAGVSFALKQLPDSRGRTVVRPTLDGCEHWDLPWRTA